MTISVDPLTYIITIPKADLTLIQASPEVRELDLDWFRLELKNWEDNAEGMVQPKTHDHNTEVTLAGLTYSRIIEVLSPYTVEFEDGQYSINCTGANHNLSDVKVVNQVSLIVNNAAGLITTPDIEYASFQSGVWVDSDNGNDQWKGNEQYPVATMDRALVVASYRGFKKLYLLSDMTIGTGHDIDDFIIIGQSHVHTDLVIETAAEAQRVRITQCNVSGVIDGDTEIEDCVVGDISYFNGHISRSGLMGTITLAGGNNAVISNCRTIDQDSPPVINMGGTGQSLAMPNYSGVLEIGNLSDSTQEIGVGMDAGMLTLSSDVTSGTIILAGIGILVDQSPGTANINTDGLLNRELITKTTWDKVYLDEDSTETGTNFPVGTLEHPASSLVDALIIARANNIITIFINGAFTATSGQDLSDLTIIAERSLGNSFTVESGAITDGTYFENLTVSGVMNGSVRYTTCVLGAITNFDGGAKNSLLTDNITIVGTGANYFTECDTYMTSDSYKTLSVGTSSLNLIRCRGAFEIADLTGTQAIACDLDGHFKVASSCVSGIVAAGGNFRMTDESGAGCTVIDGSLNVSQIAEGVWEHDHDA
jgi:hypothetical protein